MIGAETPRPTRESDQLAAVTGEQRDAREENSFEVLTGRINTQTRLPNGTYTALALPALYFLLGAIAVTMWLWRDPASRLVAGNPNDTDQFAWYFRYSATAVAHFQLPGMITDGMNAPQGISVMWNTFMLLPGMLLAPVTLLAGPQASLTVLMTVGFAGSALAMFVVLRRWDASILAAALGGAIYGFSPALIQSSLGHYDLQFAVLPPLIANAALRLLTGRYGAGGRAAARCGAWLGLLVAAQVFIAEELLFDTGIAVLIMAAVTMASRPRALAGRVREVAVGLVAATGVAAVIAGYPLWIQFFGPLRQRSSPFTPDFFKNDLAGLVQPSSFMLLHTTSSAAFANAFQARAPEYLAYLGWPMLVVLVLVTVLFYRLLPVRVSALTFAVLAVLSLGGTLLAGGQEHAAVKLPWYWLQTLPVTGSVLPDRFSITIADGAAARRSPSASTLPAGAGPRWARHSEAPRPGRRSAAPRRSGAEPRTGSSGAWRRWPSFRSSRHRSRPRRRRQFRPAGRRPYRPCGSRRTRPSWSCRSRCPRSPNRSAGRRTPVSPPRWSAATTWDRPGRGRLLPTGTG